MQSLNSNPTHPLFTYHSHIIHTFTLLFNRLTYWVVVAFLSLLEVFFGFVVAFIPMYHLVK
jgi:hypothetical protein